MAYTCIDSFCGAGGLGLGLAKAGFDIVYGFDIDHHSINTIKRNPQYFSHRVECADICKINSKELMKELGLKKGDLDLWAGGPPCQGFSIQRIGNDIDERNQLVYEYVKKVRDFFPKFFLLENVPGIMGKRGEVILSDALKELEILGYNIQAKIIDAQDYGIPQRRKRVIIVGQRISKELSKFKYPEPMGVKVTVRDAIGDLPAPPEGGKEHPDISLHRADKLSPINIKRIQYLKPGQGRDYLPTELLAECHKVSSAKIGHRNVYGRMPWDDVAPTITAKFDSFTRGQFGHPEQDRSISLREGALLQTFPIDFIFTGNKVEIARQIGNAVPVQLAEIIGLEIIKCICNEL